MAVVAALDLDDQVAPGHRAHQVDGVHRGLGAGVGEPPQRQAEPLGQVLGDRRSRPSVGWAKWVPQADPLADRRDDGRVGVAGERDAVAAVQVDVLGAVDVVQLGAGAVAEPDRLRRGDLPVRRGAAGEVPLGPRDQLGAAGLALQK